MRSSHHLSDVHPPGEKAVIKLNLLFPLGALAALAFGTAVAQPAPVSTEKVQSISATVDKIDAKTRTIELRKDKEVQSIQVPPEVRNFDKIKVGDEVVVTYYEGLAAEFKKKGESKTVGVLDASTGTARMPEGSGKPGAAVGNRIKTTVTIESVDTKTHSVTFIGPSGMSRTVDVVDPKAQKFIAELKKGDEVELTYVEALAVTVEPKLAK
jgi:Cu/Ag efflux protein CusF